MMLVIFKQDGNENLKQWHIAPECTISDQVDTEQYELLTQNISRVSTMARKLFPDEFVSVNQVPHLPWFCISFIESFDYIKSPAREFFGWLKVFLVENE